jgi:Leucine-rich repeat (LRR) protein
VRHFYNRERNPVGDTTNEQDRLHYVETVKHNEIDSQDDTRKEDYFQVDNCPRHFLWLSDQAVEYELEYRRKYGTWRERVLVEKFYFTLFYGGTGMASKYMDFVDDFQTELDGWNVMDLNRTTTNHDQHCEWEGVECDEEKNVIKFSIHGFSLEGSLPTDLHYLTSLKHLALNGNLIKGTVPASWGKLTSLVTLDMSDNQLSHHLPRSLARLTNLEKVWFKSNQLEGTIMDHFINQWTELKVLDLSHNNFSGQIPKALVTKSKHLQTLRLESNALTGTLPELQILKEAGGKDGITSQRNGPMSSFAFEALGDLQEINLSSNQLTGTIPTSWLTLPRLQDLDLSSNRLTGSPIVLQLTNLKTLNLSNNQFSGLLPTDSNGGKWSDLSHLTALLLNDNLLHGTLPPELLVGLGKNLVTLDVGHNKLDGEIPSEIGKMQKIVTFNAQGNLLKGSLPSEMNRMFPEVQLNLTNNLLTGTVPKIFCGGGEMSSDMLYKLFGCDAVLCPAGTFHPNGAATLYSGCRPCLAKERDDNYTGGVLGRTSCGGTLFVHGDLNGDGLLSEREVLRLFYTYNMGSNWGSQFESWADPSFEKCDLAGITCVDDSVAKIDLTDAAVCHYGDNKKPGPNYKCLGIPAEISRLSNLEILTMNRRAYLRGTLPSEIGLLSRLKYLDISSCSLMSGPLPSELGHLSKLQYMNLGGCRFNGTIPEELFRLTNLEKLHLSTNFFTGSLSSSLGQLSHVKEFMLSRTQMTGTIPTEIGLLTALENLEMYGNKFTSTLPDTLGHCTALKRIDLFNNQLTGTIPESLARVSSLQIIHIKLNSLTGTISSGFGELPFLSWFDVSSNQLHGTIPASFGQSQTLKDFRLGGGNMFYDPIPDALCMNENINGGLTKTYGCSGVICPLGTYSDPGHATHADGCKPCPAGKTTLYLGSSACIKFDEEDYIAMIYDIMAATNNFSIQKGHWDLNREGDVCTWNGISCDEKGEVESISFPLLGLQLG